MKKHLFKKNLLNLIKNCDSLPYLIQTYTLPCPSHLSDKKIPFKTGITKDIGFLTIPQPLLPVRCAGRSSTPAFLILPPRDLLFRQMQSRDGNFLLPSSHTQNVDCILSVALLRTLVSPLSLPWLLGEFHGKRGKLRPRSAAPTPIYQIPPLL